MTSRPTICPCGSASNAESSLIADASSELTLKVIRPRTSPSTTGFRPGFLFMAAILPEYRSFANPLTSYSYSGNIQNMKYARAAANHTIEIIALAFLGFVALTFWQVAHETPRQACIILSNAAGDSTAHCALEPGR